MKYSFFCVISIIAFLSNNLVVASSIDEYFLHKAICASNKSDSDFNRGLQLKLNPQKTKENGNTLWHSLIEPSPSNYLQNILESRAKILNQLNVNPYQKNNTGNSAIDIIIGEITFLSNSLSKKLCSQECGNSTEIEIRTLKKLSHFLAVIMETHIVKTNINNSRPLYIQVLNNKPLRRNNSSINIGKSVMSEKNRVLCPIKLQKHKEKYYIYKDTLIPSLDYIISTKVCNRELRINSWYLLRNISGKFTELRMNCKTGILHTRSFYLDQIDHYILDEDKEFPLNIILKK